MLRLSLVVFALAGVFADAASGASIPHLRKQGVATQLIVDDRPFLILGGELANSSASNLAYLKPRWPRLAQLNLNTVLAPVSWELIEPEQGRFDFAIVDGLIRDARAHDMRLVLLWFGSWKNSMSSYVPAWIKRDPKRFERVRTPDGRQVDILSAFSESNREADAAAFRALLAHLKTFDQRRTVIMVQVENEVAMLPVAREYGAAANAAYAGAVPQRLLEFLAQHRERLHPTLRSVWESNGSKTRGSWESVFGPGIATEEIFTAWHYARYVDAVAQAGKAEYPLPMFANAALNRPRRLPGEYPSGGPLPHLIDIWKAGAPTLDFLSPDIYFPNFQDWIAPYARRDNALFVPEANRAGRPEAGAEAFLAIGRYDAMGVSPFSIDSVEDPTKDRLSGAYATLQQIAPIVLEHQGTGRMTAVQPPVSYEGAVDTSPQQFELGGYRFHATFLHQWTPVGEQRPATHGAIIVNLGEDEFLVAGSGVYLEFESLDATRREAGIESIWEGEFAEGRWMPGRLLNGDESHQGRRLMLPREEFGIQKLRLYRY